MIEFHSESSFETEKLKYLFCYVLWKQISPNTSYFSQSAVVCANSYELPRVCSFLPAQRILAKCARTVIPLNLGSHKVLFCSMFDSFEMFIVDIMYSSIFFISHFYYFFIVYTLNNSR